MQKGRALKNLCQQRQVSMCTDFLLDCVSWKTKQNFLLFVIAKLNIMYQVSLVFFEYM